MHGEGSMVFMTVSGKRSAAESLVPGGRLSVEWRHHPLAERRVPGGQN